MARADMAFVLCGSAGDGLHLVPQCVAVLAIAYRLEDDVWSLDCSMMC